MDGELAAWAATAKDGKESQEEKRNQTIENGDSPRLDKISNSKSQMTKGSVSKHNGDWPPHAKDVQNAPQHARDDQRYW